MLVFFKLITVLTCGRAPTSPATTSSSASMSEAARTFWSSCWCSYLDESIKSSSSIPANFVITCKIKKKKKSQEKVSKKELHPSICEESNNIDKTGHVGTNLKAVSLIHQEPLSFCRVSHLLRVLRDQWIEVCIVLFCYHSYTNTCGVRITGWFILRRL